MPVNLEPILAHVPAWLMVLFRLTGIFIFAPVLGSKTIPGQVKVFLAVGLSFCIYPMLLEPTQASSVAIERVIDHGLSLWTLIPQVAVELLLGLVVGYAASLPMVAMQVGGHVIDQQMGIGLAGVFNPELNEQAGIVGEFLFMLSLAIFVILGGHRLMLTTLIGSFEHIPLGGFNGFDALVQLVVGLISIMFDLALQIAAPLISLFFLITVAMGFIARTVPQFNILSVGFAIRIMGGAVVLLATIGVMGQAYIEVCHDVFGYLGEFLGF